MTKSMYKPVLVVAGLSALAAVPVMVAPSSTAPAQSAGDVAAASHRVDAAFERAWQDFGVQPLGPADPLLVARRLSLALSGTIPSLEEIRSLEALPANERVTAHLERLLADRRFADYFAERLARAYVGTNDGPFIVFRRRRFVYWLSDKLAENQPYDQLVRQILTTEGLWTDQPATNFVTAHVIENKGPDPLALAARTTRAFLGVRIDCAQCHDHPFTEWTQQDFEGIAAFFGQTKQTLRGIKDTGGELEIEDLRTQEKRVAQPRVPFAADELPDEKRRRQQFAEWIVGPKLKTGDDELPHDYFSEAIANRVWTLMFSQGICEPVDDLEADRRVSGVLEVLGEDFRANGFDLRRLIRVIAGTRAFRMSAGDGTDVTEEHEKRFAAFPLTRLRSEQIAGSLIQASSLHTVDADSHILVRATRFFNTIDFIKSYGDAGEEELNAHVGTIPQRLVMMNGKMPRERLQASPMNAAGRISQLAPSDESRVRTVYLVALTRLPTPHEQQHFIARLAESRGKQKQQGVEDLLWALFNSTEFGWNH